MSASLAAIAVALAVCLPIFALGERIRERQEHGLRNTHPTFPKGPLMSKYSAFKQVARDQAAFAATYRRFSIQEWGSLLLENGTFVFSTEEFTDFLDSDIEIYLGDGAWLEVHGGLTPNVHLTLPEEYVEALDQAPTTSGRSRRLYWSSPTPPEGLNDPSQNPYGYGDVTLYVPESLEPAYRGKGFSEWGTPSRRYLEIWDYEPPADDIPAERGPGEAVESPNHYTWLGQALAALGLSDAANVESWDVLDAAFPSDPMLWNAGKYLLRQGRKGGEEKRLEDLRKARAYLDRQIARLSLGGE